MIAIGDEDLLAEDAVGALLGWLGTGTDCAEVGSGLRFGEVHGRRPLAGDEARQVTLLQGLVGVGVDRLDRTGGEQRPDREGRRARIPELLDGSLNEERQTLP